MSRKNNEKFIVFVVTLAAVGLIIETMLMGWEFWVPVVILVGIVSLWAVNLSDRIDYGIRKVFYFSVATLLVFYHGIHKTSLYDSALVVAFVMIIFTLLNSVYMMNIFLIEYFVILFIHFINLPGGEPIVYDRLNTSRLLLHIAIVLLFYYFSVRAVNEKIYSEEDSRILIRRIEENDANMEDFLSNISHELRTPVNVVNGMSDLLIKKGVGYEAESIKKAGVRLAYQIEDIQDYTECKKNSVFLEEDDYMSISLINDVVTSFRMNDDIKDLELVVDLDPSVPSMMKGDIKKLHKIFRHLLGNAIKFTRKAAVSM